MSSSYYPNHHDPEICPTCGKRKEKNHKKLEEKNDMKDFNPSTFKMDPQSMKHLFTMLLTLLTHFDFEKDKKHDKEKDSKHPHHESECKHCKMEQPEWWKHEDKKHHDKTPSKWEEKYEVPEKHSRHYELEPSFTEYEEVDEFMMDDSSSFEYDFPKYGKHKCSKCDKFHFELESSSSSSSSSEEMKKKMPHHDDKPDHIWLPDILKLLYKHNLLNLDHLFEQMKKDKEHDEKHQCKHCKKEHHWKDEYDYVHGKEEYTKKYYYKGMPLKKVKRKADPYKKFME